MNKDELVSVLVPVYNVEEYLGKCLDSIIGQTYSNLEIILVDASTDSGAAMCDEYAVKDSRIKVIHKDAEGLADARNTGLDNATGEYIFFVDSDDWLNPDTIEYLYTLLTEHNADMATASKVILELNGKENRVYWDNGRKGEEAVTVRTSDEDKQIRTTATAWGRLCKKELYDGIRYPYKKNHEDEFVTYKLYHRAKSIVVSNKIIYNQNSRADSLMNTGFSESRFHVVEALDEKTLYFDEFMPDIAYWPRAQRCFALAAIARKMKKSSIEDKKQRIRDIKRTVKREVRPLIRQKKLALSVRTYFRIYRISPFWANLMLLVLKR